jgi:hypothetical protein
VEEAGWRWLAVKGGEMRVDENSRQGSEAE